jgi:hypothetical protein
MKNAFTSKKAGAAVAAVLLTGALFGGSATAANAAYPSETPVAVKVTNTPPKSVKAGKAFKISGKSVKGAKVTISYGKTKKKSTKKIGSDTASKSGKFSDTVKIKKKGTYFVKVTVKKAGKPAKTVYYKIKVK